jgi:hypothetical protein
MQLSPRFALRRHHGDGSLCKELPPLPAGNLMPGYRMASHELCGCEAATSGQPYRVVEEIDPNGLDDWSWLPRRDEAD